MRPTFFASAFLALIAIPATSVTAQVGGKFYGVHWDGSAEHFVTVDPVAGSHSSVAVIPGVSWVDAAFRVFDPDSSRFVFVGGDSTSSMSYQVVDAPTGIVTHTFPRTQNIKNPAYDPGTGMLYGTWWLLDTATSGGMLDSAGHMVPAPQVITGTEYFAAIDTRTGARTDTPVPGVRAVTVSGHFFDVDSGRYVFHATDTAGINKYYVVDVATSNVIDEIPVDIRIDFPVYNSALGVVHGLWWSDSSSTTTTTPGGIDSASGLPIPGSPVDLRGAEYFVTLHRDSTLDLVKLPGVRYIANFNRALDTDSGRYVFSGQEAFGGLRYFVIDVATGAVLSNTLAAGNVNHLVYAPLASTVYPANPVSVRDPAGLKASAWSLRRGPDGSVDLAFDNADGAPHAFALRDMTGRIVWSRAGIRSGSLRMDASGLKSGVYIFTLRNAKGLAAAGKLIVE